MRLAIVIAVLLAGCASWKQEGKGPQEFEADMAECMAKAAPAAADPLLVAVVRDRCMGAKGWRR